MAECNLTKFLEKDGMRRPGANVQEYAVGKRTAFSENRSTPFCRQMIFRIAIITKTQHRAELPL
jgi:hypothetical protein